jgi:hypothetical protein
VAEVAMSRTDVLVLIPVVPLFPVIATWWVPWEKWLPGKIPTLISGPYLFYAAFAAWYLKLGNVTVVLAIVIGALTTIAGIFEKIVDRMAKS